MTSTSEPVWEIPEPLSTSEVRVDDDTVITLRRHGNPAGPRLVLSHGSGLAIDLYYPFWSLLTDDFDLIIYDLRNHGWNSAGPLQKHNMPTLIQDHDCILAAIDHHYGKKPKIGVFHSVAALVPRFYRRPKAVNLQRTFCLIPPCASPTTITKNSMRPLSARPP